MITRIVKMEFAPENVPAFLANFDLVKDKIRNFPGCDHLELWRGKDDGATFFTHSRWESPEHLDIYRNSPIFKEVWATTKAMFRSKAQAWSVDSVEVVGE